MTSVSHDAINDEKRGLIYSTRVKMAKPTILVDGTEVNFSPGMAVSEMFGEYALYIGGKVVALACDNSLYVKPTCAVEELAPSLEMRAPYPGAKPHVVVDELLDDAERLKKILLATASALPVPLVKPAKKRRAEK